MPEYQTVNVTKRGGGAIVELNRPERMNAWDLELGDELHAALRELREDDEVRAVMVTGAGRGFSSGADLAEDRSGEGGPPDLSKRLREHYHPIFHQIREMPKPVIAAVNGPAAGVGCSLALACDLVIAAHSSFFLLAFVNIGLVPDGGSTAYVPARIGLARANEMMMLGERISAEKAADWGLINRVVPDEILMSEANALLDRLAAGPTLSYAAQKQLVNRRLYADLEGQLEAEAAAQKEMGASKDFIEGVVAFMQKRPPEFTGS